MSNPGQIIKADIVYDPVAKFLVKKSIRSPSFVEYEKNFEETVTIKQKVILTNKEEIKRVLMQKKKKDQCERLKVRLASIPKFWRFNRKLDKDDYVTDIDLTFKRRKIKTREINKEQMSFQLGQFRRK